MQKPFVLLLIILFMQRCLDEHNLISSNNIKSIIITLDSSQHKIGLNKIEIINRDSLDQIIRKLNECDQEPIKFYPTHRLKLIYENGQEKMVFCNASSMKYEGLTYKLSENVRNIIGY